MKNESIPQNKRIPDDEFMELRKEVLSQWPTGRDVDLNEAIKYHHSLPPERNMALQLVDAKKNGKTLIAPRAGLSEIEMHIDLLKHCQDVGLADILPTSVDSMTRNLKFEEAEKAIQESREKGRSVLNGFPVVNYGVEGSRRVVESFRVPIHLRATTPDLRIAAEIGFAGGMTGLATDPMYGVHQAAVNVPIGDAIRNWQYTYKLMGYYEQNGVPIADNIQGSVASVPLPFGILHALSIISALLLVEQGGKHLNFGISQQGNLYQDIAAVKSLYTVCEHYLKLFGYEDITITSDCKHWAGKWPTETVNAIALVCSSSLVGALTNAEHITVKSVGEGRGLPTKESQSTSLLATRCMVNLIKRQGLSIVNDPAVLEEQYMIEKETYAILDRVLELGDGDIAVGTVRAFEAGVLDVPFAPSRFCQGKMTAVRDHRGAARYFDYGSVPVPEEVKRYHEQKIKLREKELGHKIGFKEMTDDILSYMSDFC